MFVQVSSYTGRLMFLLLILYNVKLNRNLSLSQVVLNPVSNWSYRSFPSSSPFSPNLEAVRGYELLVYDAKMLIFLIGETIIPPKGLMASLRVFSTSEMVSVELYRIPIKVLSQVFHEITSWATNPREWVLPPLVLAVPKVILGRLWLLFWNTSMVSTTPADWLLVLKLLNR